MLDKQIIQDNKDEFLLILLYREYIKFKKEKEKLLLEDIISFEK